MARTFTLVALALASCKPNVDQAKSRLSSTDPDVRATAASVLRAAYAKDPASLGDHGNAYWEAQLARLIGKKETEISTILVGSEVQGGEGGGGGATDHVVLDACWSADVFYSTRADGRVFGYDPPRRSVKRVDVEAPPGFSGTWRTYFVHGAVADASEYRAGVLQRDREYHESGQLRFDRNYVSGKLDGRVLTLFTDGTTEWDQTYALGKQVGVERWYHPNGKVRQEAHYADGKLEGRMTNFDIVGAPTYCADYKGGVSVVVDCAHP